MSFTLDYVTLEPVQRPVAAQIVKAAEPLLKSHDWWAEPLRVQYEPKSKKLEGSTRIVLGGYGSVEIPADEEDLMFCRDTRVIITNLTLWSARFEVSWNLSYAGFPIGDIVAGKMSPGVEKMFNGACSGLKLPMSSAPEILKKHEARKN